VNPPQPRHPPVNRLDRLEALLKEVEQFKDEQSARTTREIISLLMDVHGSALKRVLELAAPRHSALVDELAADELVSSILVLYDLHPLDTDARVRQALKKVHCDGEILEISHGIARIRVNSDFPASETIEQAIYDQVPDVTRVEIILAERLVAGNRRALPVLS